MKLARKTVVATPTPGAEALRRNFTSTSPIAVRERITSKSREQRTVTFDLVLGDARGPLGDCTVAAASEPAFQNERAWSPTPLATPPKTKGTVLATRRCVSDDGTIDFAVERRGDVVVLWKRGEDRGSPDVWSETALTRTKDAP